MQGTNKWIGPRLGEGNSEARHSIVRLRQTDAILRRRLNPEWTLSILS